MQYYRTGYNVNLLHITYILFVLIQYYYFMITSVPASIEYLEERHTVDEALGCMVPLAFGASFLLLALLKMLKLIF